MNLAHVAWFKRSEGHVGGVPLFAHLFSRCLGAQEWSWSDYPAPRPAVDEPTAAGLLGEWLSASGRLAGADAVVVDGFWGRGLRLPCPVVTVAHGTWRGIARATGSATAAHLGDVQAGEYARLPVVAVSKQTARELSELYGVTPAAIIPNAVDTEEFCPDRRIPWRDDDDGRTLVLYPSEASSKGGNVVRALRQLMPSFTFQLIGGSIGEEAERIAQADLFLSPSLTEGNSYAALQAMASGVPVVTSKAGIFADVVDGELDGYPVGIHPEEVGTDTRILQEWAGALQTAAEYRNQLAQGARSWAVKYASLPRWTEQWRAFLQGLVDHAD
jgi:glycosyltransferase involved in cell wall biosynthesis